ncbi:YheT family hydrolase [Solimonas sp. SE-A11]|uniref:YheT family hydrolase n=1 Tax=Solimonas sp. SE-A11 TaxID=3054954 RepID=UPI00259C91DF|nr:alpha/beta fold hydrolase [Solimonas sp. SE-A11]MDM4769932.1 alpha/beta fold hydrolase [Solimonas sp. SE-A11]
MMIVLALLLALWFAHYRLRAVSRPQVDFHPSAFNRAVLGRLDQLRQAYHPTPWLYNHHLQVIWLMLSEAITPRLRYERHDVLTMRDGGTTALDWLGLDTAPETPTLVLLHTVTGDAQSMRVIANDMRKATGWRVVLCTRRGHGGLPLTAPRVNTMGCTDDLREQLQRIRDEFPASPLYAVGASAGSGLLVRYLGEEGPRSLIQAGVAYCPGYDIGVAWTRAKPFYSRAMATRLKRHFLEPHSQSFAHLGSYNSCLAATDLSEFHQNLYEMAGCASVGDYLQRSNPMGVFNSIAVPMMILNADDDPVCVVENVLDHLDAIKRIPDALLVRSARGSHCAFFEGWAARSWANRLIAGYLVAAHEQLTPSEEAANAGAQALNLPPAGGASLHNGPMPASTALG